MWITIKDAVLDEGFGEMIREPQVEVEGEVGSTPEEVAKAYLTVKKLLKEESCQ